MLAKSVADEVIARARRLGYGDECLFAIKLAMEEALVNAIKHGNGCRPDRKVEVRFEITDQSVTIQVTDQGEGFRPDQLPDPTADENLECPNGRGVMLIRAYMDEVEYIAPGNCVRMVKRNISRIAHSA